MSSEATIVDFTEAPAVGQKAVLLFWATWHEASVEGGPMDAVLRALAQTSSSSSSSTNGSKRLVQFGRVQADACPALAEKYGVSAVPTFVLLNAAGKVVKCIQGGQDVSEITQAVNQLINDDDHSSSTADNAAVAVALSSEERLAKRLDGLIRSAEVMLFMKGVPGAPRCGFSRQAVEILQEENIPFSSFDILQDEHVRQGLKKHSNWPTYPQLYVKGNLMGGLDIMKETKQEGSLRDQFGISSDAAIGSSDNNTGSTSTGGAAAAPGTPVSLEDRLGALVRRSRVMLFMKGLPSAPRCGFSRQMVEILNGQQGVAYDSFDILQDEEVRQGLKKFSDWPTYPQLYVQGELVGGLDIVKEMKQDGTLKDALRGIEKA